MVKEMMGIVQVHDFVKRSSYTRATNVLATPRRLRHLREFVTLTIECLRERLYVYDGQEPYRLLVDVQEVWRACARMRVRGPRNADVPLCPCGRAQHPVPVRAAEILDFIASRTTRRGHFSRATTLLTSLPTNSTSRRARTLPSPSQRGLDGGWHGSQMDRWSCQSSLCCRLRGAKAPHPRPLGSASRLSSCARMSWRGCGTANTLPSAAAVTVGAVAVGGGAAAALIARGDADMRCPARHHYIDIVYYICVYSSPDNGCYQCPPRPGLLCSAQAGAAHPRAAAQPGRAAAASAARHAAWMVSGPGDEFGIAVIAIIGDDHQDIRQRDNHHG